MSDKKDGNNVVNVEKEDNSTPWWVWVLLLLLIALLIGGIFLFREIRNNVVENQDSEINLIAEEDVDVVPTVRIPGKGSQEDHSGGVQFARIEVHDDEPANEFGWYDRTVVNTESPRDIGLNDDFTVPEGWKVERDYSLEADAFMPYFTVKPLTSANIEAINTWAEKNDLQSNDYEITSVVVDVETGQECSVRGLNESRVRINIYVGSNWTFQTCPPVLNN